MLQFPIDNISVEVGEHNFQQIIDIPMGTKYTPLLFNLLFYAYSYEAHFTQKLIKYKRLN